LRLSLILFDFFFGFIEIQHSKGPRGELAVVEAKAVMPTT
jgi:hypothetical protein